MKRWLVGATAWIALTAGSAPAQQCLTATRVPQLTFERPDEVRATFEAVAGEVEGFVASSGWGDLANEADRDRYRTLVDHARVILALMSDRRAPEREILRFGERFRSLLDYIDAIYPGPSLPVNVNRCVAPLTSLLAGQQRERSAEYFRRFAMKYGPDAERLNFIELVALNVMTRARGMEAFPNPFELIVRVQAVGYQWYKDSADARPSSPVLQAGLTYYFLGAAGIDRRLRALNHVGVAYAYERDLVRDATLRGAMLHLWRVDFGVLHSAKTGTVFATSVNVQLIRKWL